MIQKKFIIGLVDYNLNLNFENLIGRLKFTINHRKNGAESGVDFVIKRCVLRDNKCNTINNSENRNVTQMSSMLLDLTWCTKRSVSNGRHRTNFFQNKWSSFINHTKNFVKKKTIFDLFDVKCLQVISSKNLASNDAIKSSLEKSYKG
ncbi:hypothetical protein BpHYR1_025689 [Brachionus plicatilis]|uniref:Uncharacterized protein n=1 Tax=Brachionus plicatilis TaxID=10195 RepID=A0A3M7SGQ0_BRAPC|nr:hypothetical protein BpHYR1_025689 [Brachionus plicatilis]